MFLFWRALHLRNDFIFRKGKESIAASAIFVDNYWSSFTSCDDTIEIVLGNKSKEKMGGAIPVSAPLQDHVLWNPPLDNYIKINVDASYVESITAAYVGVVARNSSDEVIISSWDFLGQCSNVNEAACMPGRPLYRYHSSLVHYFGE